MDCHLPSTTSEPKTLKYSFVNFLIDIPSKLDITSIIARKLEESSWPLLIVQRLILFCNSLLEARHRLYHVCCVSYDSLFYTCHVDVHPLLFFEELVNESLMMEYSYNREYFIELAMKTIIFNNISHAKVQQLINRLTDIVEYLHECDECYRHRDFDTKYCPCDQYSTCQDCYCDENDGPPSKIRCLSMPDISDKVELD